MYQLPANLRKIALFLKRLPGIGEKTANRLAFFLLKIPNEDLQDFAQSISQLKRKTKMCQVCFNFTEDKICSICQDEKRDKGVIMVVETVADLLSFEVGGIYQGVYHVLHGKIDPLNRIGPEDIKINDLLIRIKKSLAQKASIREIILATNPDMEGEATALFIKKKLEKLKQENAFFFKISRLAYGLPVGANLEYADYVTLKRAMDNRINY
jgi:recombination protein RecR